MSTSTRRGTPPAWAPQRALRAATSACASSGLLARISPVFASRRVSFRPAAGRGSGGQYQTRNAELAPPPLPGSQSAPTTSAARICGPRPRKELVFKESVYRVLT